MKDIFSDVIHNEEGLSCGQYSTIISKLEVQLLKIYSGYNNLPNQIVKKVHIKSILWNDIPI